MILERANNEMSKEFKENLNTSVANFSRIGLRTLLVASLPLSEEVFAAFLKDYHDAETSMENREEKLQQVSEQLEKNLTILGATAVEDKLQDEVAETIDYLIQAGIRVWMLTGDKLETAISIGRSTKFLSEGMILMIVDAEDTASTGQIIDRLLEQNVKKQKVPQTWNQLGIVGVLFQSTHLAEPVTINPFSSSSSSSTQFYRKAPTDSSSPERPWFTPSPITPTNSSS